ADDSIIFVKSEKAANRVMKSVTHFIEKKLGLIVNAEKSRISRPGNIKFLGFGFYYDAHTKKYRPRVHQESRSEEHTSELQSRFDLVCRLLLEKKNETYKSTFTD